MKLWVWGKYMDSWGRTPKGTVHAFNVGTLTPEEDWAANDGFARSRCGKVFRQLSLGAYMPTAEQAIGPWGGAVCARCRHLYCTDILKG